MYQSDYPQLQVTEFLHLAEATVLVSALWQLPDPSHLFDDFCYIIKWDVFWCVQQLNLLLLYVVDLMVIKLTC